MPPHQQVLEARLKLLSIVISAAFLFGATALAQDATPPAKDEVNLFALTQAALVEKEGPVASGWDALNLTDDNPATGWANEDGQKPPFEIVLSLPERSEIRRLEFDTDQSENPERSAKDVDILIADGPTAAYRPVMSVVLDGKKDHQSFTPPALVTGQWVKLVIKSNHGDPKYWEIMEARGFGVALTNTPPPNVSGTYSSDEFGDFHLQQDGAQLVGCYVHKQGLVQGGLENHLMRLQWTENDGDTTTHGPALMILARDGKSFRGFWGNDGDTALDGRWNLKKLNDKVGSCPHWSPKGATANIVTTTLAKEGRVRLYGINFDTNIDTPRADAKPTLEQLLDSLKTNPDWKITIEGHTDSVGTPEKNQDLSQRRAASIKAYLVKGGIDAARLTPAGFGQTKPVASNDTDIGRAQNRRVEIAKD
jgi:outer membrane protein OmpA-like peptidoglycan-associated protein